MNLSPIHNMPTGAAQANPANTNSAQGKISAEMASFQDFLALMGLSPLAGAEGEEEAPGDAAGSDPAALATVWPQDTGNFLPPALPVLPVLPEAADLVPGTSLQALPVVNGSSAAPVIARDLQAENLPPRQASPALPAPQATAAFTPDLTMTQPPAALEAVVARTSLPQNARPTAAPAQTSITLDLSLPAASQSLPQPAAVAQPQVVAQPVLAQLLHAAPRPAQRKWMEEPVATLSSAESAVAGDLSAETFRPASATQMLPPAAASAVAVAQPDGPPAQPGALAMPAPAADITPERHDFSAVIDKLAEARELARPGRADMHVAHREFGQVSVQFELAGQALKVAMTSADPGFAPAVQAALAERPVAAVADAARPDSQQPRADTVIAATASWQAGPQADGQRHDSQNRAQQARTGNGPVRQNDGDADRAGGRAADRDGSRFA